MSKSSILQFAARRALNNIQADIEKCLIESALIIGMKTTPIRNSKDSSRAGGVVLPKPPFQPINWNRFFMENEIQNEKAS
jgi:hypothetical protein